MARFGMVIDTRRCVGCLDCVAACQTENDVPLGKLRDWVVTETTGVFPNLKLEIRSERCNHCDDPPCVPVCPTGASHVSSYGKTVQITYADCIRCRKCIDACPYGARYIDPTRRSADKCTFCVHRVKEGKDPACVAVCPTRAMTFGDLDDPSSAVSKLLQARQSKVLKPEAGTRPRVFYLT
jgi:Fe-S-cluster-containing dehydrogenase component